MRRPPRRLQASRLEDLQNYASEMSQALKTNFDQGLIDTAPEIQVLVAGQGVLILLLLAGVVPFGGLLEFIAGPGLIVAGAALSIVGFLELGPGNMTPFSTPVKENQLKTNGVYALSRHPMYVGLMAFSVGFAVASHSFQRIVIALLLYLLLDYKATIEEELLAKIHAGYAAYQSLVPKFLPNILFLMRTDSYLSTAFVQDAPEVAGDLEGAAAKSVAAVGEVTSGRARKVTGGAETTPDEPPSTTTEETTPPKGT